MEMRSLGCETNFVPLNLKVGANCDSNKLAGHQFSDNKIIVYILNGPTNWKSLWGHVKVHKLGMVIEVESLNC